MTESKPSGPPERPSSERPPEPAPDQLLDLVLGELSDPDARALRARIAKDPALLARLERLEVEQEVLRAAWRAEPAPPGLDERIIARIRGAAPPPRRRRPWSSLLAAAAGLLVAVGVGQILWERGEPRREILRCVRVSELKALGLER